MNEDEGRGEGVILLDITVDEGSFDQSMLERLGHRVVMCTGPEVGAVCPLVGGADCSKFDEAHGIVFGLDLDRPAHRAIVQRYRDLGGSGLTIRVVVRPEQAVRYAELLSQFQVWDHAPTAADLDGFAAQVEASDRAS